MSKKLAAAIAVAAGVLIMPNMAQANGVVSNLQSISNIGQVHQIKNNGHHNHRRARHNRHKKHRHFGGHFYFGHDYYGRPSYHSCRRLKRRAYATGSRYWWKRYRRCMNRNYY